MKFTSYKITLLFILLFNTLSECKKDKLPERSNSLSEFSAIDICDTGSELRYSITISESNNSIESVILYKLYAWEENNNATIFMNSLDIPSQVADVLTFLENKLVISFSISNGLGGENHNAICTKS